MAENQGKDKTDENTPSDSAKNSLGGRKPANPPTGGEVQTTTPADPAKTDDDTAVDEPVKKEKKSALSIHIKLDLDVEVHLTARVKGDITIGLL